MAIPLSSTFVLNFTSVNYPDFSGPIICSSTGVDTASGNNLVYDEFDTPIGGCTVTFAYQELGFEDYGWYMSLQTYSTDTIYGDGITWPTTENIPTSWPADNYAVNIVLTEQPPTPTPTPSSTGTPTPTPTPSYTPTPTPTPTDFPSYIDEIIRNWGSVAEFSRIAGGIG